MSVCVCLPMSFCILTQKEIDPDINFEYIVLSENNSNKFDIGRCFIKVKVTVQ